MSNKNLARRTRAEIAFAGVDITRSIQPYLLSLQYTDSEEGEADDLQIVLQDRDLLWTEKWIGPMIQAASSTRTESKAAGGNSSKTYKVTPAIGLNIRTGPGVQYSKLGAFPCGTSVQVESIENGWAKIQHGGRTAYISAAYIQPAGEGASGKGETALVPALKIQAVLLHLH